VNPKTGEIEEKHAKKPAGNLEKYFTDKKTHLYTLGKVALSLIVKTTVSLIVAITYLLM